MKQPTSEPPHAANQLRCRMPWTRKLASPITLKDGRTIATLNQARELMLSLPLAHQRGNIWRHVAILLNEAAADNSYIQHTEAEALLGQALKVEGLL
jgi:hypothetical protein